MVKTEKSLPFMNELHVSVEARVTSLVSEGVVCLMELGISTFFRFFAILWLIRNGQVVTGRRN